MALRKMSLLELTQESLTNIWKAKRQMMNTIPSEIISSISQMQRTAASFMLQRYIGTQKRESTYTMLSAKQAVFHHMIWAFGMKSARNF